MSVQQSELLLRSAVTDEDIPLEGEMRIGREKDCEIQIDDIHISRYHARIAVKDGQILLEDLHSTNGTFVNGNRIQGQQVVSVGDELRFHHCLFRLVSNYSGSMDQTVFGWPVNAGISPPEVVDSGEARAIAAKPAAAAPELADKMQRPVSPTEAQASPERQASASKRSKKSAIQRQLHRQHLETDDFLQRVRELPLGTWLVLNDRDEGVYVLCKLIIRAGSGDRLRFVSDTGLYTFEKSSRELALDLQYERARILDKAPLFGRIAVVLTGAVRRAQRAEDKASRVA
jgi:hypothetical protein